MNKILISTLTAGIFLFSGCGKNETPGNNDKIKIFAGTPPSAFLAEKIGGDIFQIEVLVKPSDNPHNFELTPQQVIELAKAKMYISSGLPFEERLSEKIGGSMGNIRMTAADAGIDRIMESGHHHEGGEHPGDEANANDGEPDLHIWMSCANLKIMAKNILDAFVEIAPDKAQEFNSNYSRLIAEITAVDDTLRTKLAKIKGSTFYVYHPAFGYFARDYGLVQDAVETGGKSPSPKQLADIIKQARAEKVKVILVQPQFDSASAEKIAEAIHGRVLPVNSMDKDVLSNMLKLAEVLTSNQ